MENFIRKLQELTSDTFGTVLSKALPGFLLSMMLTALMGYLLQWVYIRYGTALSNRKVFARNFIMLSVTTMFIIIMIKSSLALSLGLIGALSIVRFRSAIKEPEELVFLFISIAIGLGMGAGFVILTVAGFFVICGIIIVNSKVSKPAGGQNLYLTVSGNTSGISLRQIMDVLKKYCISVRLKRSDENENRMEASFLVEYDSVNELEKTKADLKTLSPSMSVSFIDGSRDI